MGHGRGAWVMTLGVFAACGAHRSSMDRLEESLLLYHTHLKAQDIERAAAYVGPEAIADFNSLHHPEMNVFVIEDFSVARMTEVPDTDRMVVVVRASVRKRDSLTLRTVRLREVWEKRGGRWLLIEEKMLAPGTPIEGAADAERREGGGEVGGPNRSR